MAPLWQLQTGEFRKTFLKTQLEQFNQGISDDKRDMKYDKMAASPFVFFRGTAHVYYADLQAQQVIEHSDFTHEQAITWLQGDLHVENYGVFCDGQGDVIFDLNDFDESWIDSYFYDVYRLAVSLLLVIEQNEPKDAQPRWDKQALLAVMTEAYLVRLKALLDKLDDKFTKITANNTKGRLQKFIAKAEQKNNRRKMLDQWTVLTGDERNFDFNNPKLEVVNTQVKAQLTEQIEAYHHEIASELKGNQDYFNVVDVAARINAGTGSLGTSRYYVLIDGHNEHEHDYRILDVKMQGEPSHYPYLPESSLTRMAGLFDGRSQGCRVVQAQQAMHVHADDHLGSVYIDGHSYSVRERSPYKKTLDSAKLDSEKRFAKLAKAWGSIAATAHARGQRDFDPCVTNTRFEQIVTSLTGDNAKDFQQQVWAFANNYCQQVNEDYRQFCEL